MIIHRGLHLRRCAMVEDAEGLLLRMACGQRRAGAAARRRRWGRRLLVGAHLEDVRPAGFEDVFHAATHCFLDIGGLTHGLTAQHPEPLARQNEGDVGPLDPQMVRITIVRLEVGVRLLLMCRGDRLEAQLNGAVFTNVEYDVRDPNGMDSGRPVLLRSDMPPAPRCRNAPEAFSCRGTSLIIYTAVWS